MATIYGTNNDFKVPSLDLRFADRKNLVDTVSGRNLITFSRDSIGTYVDENGVIQSAASGAARFDHDPVTGESLGLLVEESRTNYVLYSQEIQNSYWAVANPAAYVPTVTPNVAIAPDGTLTGSLVNFDAAAMASAGKTQQRRMNYFEPSFIESGTRVAVSYFIKKGTLSSARFFVNAVVPPYPTITYDFDTDTLSGNTSDTNALDNLTRTFYPNGWVRISATTNRRFNYQLGPFAGGDVTGSTYYWGIQVEVGTFPTSYIPTIPTFTSRASEATFYDENGIVSIASTDVARDDAYFPDENGNFISAGLLLEEERTNYVTNNTAIQLVQSNCTVGLSTGLDNNNTATTATCSSDGNFSVNANPNRGTTWPSATDTTWSFYVKSNSITEYRLDLVAGAGQGGITFTGITTTPTFENIATNITDYGVIPSGNGWYRLWAVYDDTLPNTSGMAMRVTANGGITGDTFQVWGEQCEIGTNVSSIILTSGSAVTRAADISSSSTLARGADVASIINNNIYNTEAFTIANEPFGASGGSNTLSLVGPNIKRTSVYSSNLSQATINKVLRKTDEFWRWRILGSSFGLPSFTTDGQVTVDWGDGTVETLTTSDHTFTDGGVYHEVGFRLDSGTYFRPFINDNASHDTKLVAVGPAPENMKADLFAAFSGASNLVSIDSTISLSSASNRKLRESICNDCSSLKSFPYIDFSGASLSSIRYAWKNCTSMENFPLLDLSQATNLGDAGGRGTWENCSALKSFPAIDFPNVTIAFSSWRNCSSMTEFNATGFSLCTTFYATWRDCSSLTSFPLIDTSSGTNFTNAWLNCTSLTSFSDIDTSSGTTFVATWESCSSLTSFPSINTSSGTTFYRAWYGCASLTSFPSIDISSGTNFQEAWRLCTGLTSFPANFFDSWTGTPANNCFSQAWDGCSSLTATSVENILNSIDTSGQSAPASGVDITIDYDAGTGTPSVSTAVTNLKSRGWTITLNGAAQ